MCQINNKRLKFFGDLKVYKVLVDDGVNLKAPYHSEYRYTLGKKHEEEPTKNKFSFVKPTAPAIIDEKYFHSFTNYSDAKSAALIREAANNSIFWELSMTESYYPFEQHYVVVECTIPEGTEVYQGEWQTSDGRYVPTTASKAIIPNKIIFEAKTK